MKCYMNVLVYPLLKFIEHDKCKISSFVLENGCVRHLKH